MPMTAKRRLLCWKIYMGWWERKKRRGKRVIDRNVVFDLWKCPIEV